MTVHRRASTGDSGRSGGPSEAARDLGFPPISAPISTPSYDVLTTDIEGPIRIEWRLTANAREALRPGSPSTSPDVADAASERGDLAFRGRFREMDEECGMRQRLPRAPPFLWAVHGMSRLRSSRAPLESPEGAWGKSFPPHPFFPFSLATSAAEGQEVRVAAWGGEMNGAERLIRRAVSSTSRSALRQSRHDRMPLVNRRWTARTACGRSSACTRTSAPGRPTAMRGCPGKPA
jgi:hypothetical protein